MPDDNSKDDGDTKEIIPSTAALSQHPIHPMVVTFPIAFLTGAFATDLGYWWTADPFWAQVSVWLVLAGLAMGIFAAVFGITDFVTIREVRMHIAAWNHFLSAVMALALAGANLQLRLDDPTAAVLPWGLYLSAITVVMVGIAGWLGGTLTFRHAIGTYD